MGNMYGIVYYIYFSDYNMINTSYKLKFAAHLIVFTLVSDFRAYRSLWKKFFPTLVFRVLILDFAVLLYS